MRHVPLRLELGQGTAKFFDGFWAVKGFLFFSGYFLFRRSMLVKESYRHVVRSRTMGLLLNSRSRRIPLRTCIPGRRLRRR